MPIQFDQPGPVSPAIAEGYGAAQRLGEDREFYLKQQEAAARANPPPHPPPVQGGGVSGLGVGPQYDPNAQANAHATQLNSAFALQQEQLTQADRMQMARLSQGLSEVERQHADGTLDDQAYSDAQLMLRAHLDPLQMRAAREQTNLRQQQARQLMDAHAQQTAMDNMSEAERTARYQNRRTVLLPKVDEYGEPVADDDGNPLYERHHLDHHGNLHDPQSRAQPQERLPAGVMPEQQWQATMTQLEREQHTRHPRLLPGATAEGGPRTNPRFEGRSDEQYDQFLRDAITQAARERGLGRNYHEYLQNHPMMRGRVPGGGEQGGGQGGAAGGGQGGAGGQGGGQPELPLTGRDRAQWSPRQQSTIEDFSRLFARADALPEQQRRNYMGHLSEAHRLYVTRGSVANMTPAEREAFRREMQAAREEASPATSGRRGG